MIENIPDPDIFLHNSAEFMFEAIQIVQSMVKDEEVRASLDDEHLEGENSIKIVIYAELSGDFPLGDSRQP
ncbi:TPA: hypothetical protein JI120_17230, partial [Acinetobacter baumannii]|nr:hypothetical protein [Acinetobacter baumannii]